MTGKFITFEGGEGCGKSTQVHLLAEYLRGHGHDVITTREPGGTPVAEQVREILVNGEELHPLAEILLNYAARVDHVEKVIKPALSAGKWVLSDRFFDSTAVYQGYAGGVDIAKIMEIRKIALGDFRPDKTFLLDLPAETGLERTKQRGEENRYERKGIEYHRKVREGFFKLAAGNSRIVVIDANQSPDEVHKAVVTLMQNEIEKNTK